MHKVCKLQKLKEGSFIKSVGGVDLIGKKCQLILFHLSQCLKRYIGKIVMFSTIHTNSKDSRGGKEA